MSDKTVVYIDDERDLLELFPMYFEEVGHKVVCFDNHTEAAKYVLNNTVDCLFIDFLMPCGSPEDFIKLIADRNNSDFTKYILSGSYFITDSHLEIFDAVLSKPFIFDNYDLEHLILGKVTKIS